MTNDSRTKHTPGPWHFDLASMTVRVKEFKRNPFMGDYHGCVIAGFAESTGGEHRAAMVEGCQSEAQANARLISKAPEMAELLRETLECLDLWLHDQSASSDVQEGMLISEDKISRLLAELEG